MAILYYLIIDFINIKNWTQFMANGYPSHFVIGALIGGSRISFGLQKDNQSFKDPGSLLWLLFLPLV